MSQLVIFCIGVIIFAITVYGAVMSGGLLLTRRELEDNRDVWSRRVDVDNETEQRVREAA